MLILRLNERISSGGNSDGLQWNITTADVTTSVIDASGRDLIPAGHRVLVRYRAVSGKSFHRRAGELYISLEPILVEFVGADISDCPECEDLRPGVWEVVLPGMIYAANNSYNGKATYAGDEGQLKARRSWGDAQASDNGMVANGTYTATASIPGGTFIYGIGTAGMGLIKFIFGKSNITLPEHTTLTFRLVGEARVRYLLPPRTTRPLPNAQPYFDYRSPNN